MTDRAQESSPDENTVPLIKQHFVREILGMISVSEDVTLREDGAGNSTRWVFDVETIGAGTLDVQLINMRGRKAVSDIEPSFHITPLDREAAEASLWGETVRTHLTLHFTKGCSFRVDVDIIGTSRR
jgi:hypothetical protein